MKIKTNTMILIMVLVLFACGIYLGLTKGTSEDILKGLDPTSYDITATCTEAGDNILICNKENDVYLYLNGTGVYVEKSTTDIAANGDVTTKTTYKESSIDELNKYIDAKQEAVLNLWITPNGKVENIIIREETIRNNSDTLKNLDGLDPDSYNSENMVISLDKNIITLAPVNYSEENKDKLAPFVKTYDFSKDVKYYHIDITYRIEDQKIVDKNIQYLSKDLETMEEELSQGGTVFVWFDKDGHVQHIMTVNKTEK